MWDGKEEIKKEKKAETVRRFGTSCIFNKQQKGPKGNGAADPVREQQNLLASRREPERPSASDPSSLARIRTKFTGFQDAAEAPLGARNTLGSGR